MSQDPERFQRALIEYLQYCTLDGKDILLSSLISTPQKLQKSLERVLALLDDLEPDTELHEFAQELKAEGLEMGWGRTAGSVAGTLSKLIEVCESPDPERFEAFLGKLPIIQNILMVSPHGWFAQHDVLGKPDTGGQVTYVLDQARALESNMQQRYQEAGIPEVSPKILILTRLIPDAEGTTCNEPIEKVLGTENCWIVRVPFKDSQYETIPHWISRFQIWPYLEQFAKDALDVVYREFMAAPDLVIGHYSDGNLVAQHMADAMEVTHCACVHALEKTKYLFSDMRWEELEEEYRFSLHFTADILAYNSADFIITSSYREIGGTEEEMGMFESYDTFSLPGIYRVESGMDPQLARYNIVSPGVSEEHFYPYTESDTRSKAMEQAMEVLFNAEASEQAVGHLKYPERPPVFAMSRVDKVKNLPGLIEAFGKHKTLRESSNLIILSSLTNASQSSDLEEIEQINRMYELIDEYDLHGHIRWAGIRLGKAETGEIYRLIADRGGVFAQPALMETFGLTVIESMACGLPVVVTCFGGPAEIVQQGRSGEIVNPNHHEAFGDALYKIVSNRSYWDDLSKGGIERVQEAYRWQAHAEKVLRLANVYSYWNYLDIMNRSALDHYIHTLFHTVYRPRAQAMLETK